jgi:phosphoribosylformylglycinamidine cyclo-ligase
LPDGFLTKLPDGKTFGETLLTPTHIYVAAVEDLLLAGYKIRYGVNITGHGWRKLMRLNEPFTYYIHTLPKELPIFAFMQKHNPVDDREMYGTYNMGAGFALFVPSDRADDIVGFINKGNYGYRALKAGVITSGKRQVVIGPKNITFSEKDLEVR